MALGRNHKIFNIGNASGTIQGLTRVYHDLTLSGDGTLSSLLGVVGDKADEEVNQYVYDNSATIDEVNISYQSNSGTFLTAVSIPESADWSETTDVVQTNSGKWNDITAYQNASAGYLTAHQSLADYYTTADANTLSSMLSGAIDYVSANAGDEFPASANEAITAYQNASGTYLTAINIPESATWNEVSTTVQSNSASWGQGGGVTYSAGEYIDITDNTISVSGVTDLVAGNAITITTSGTSAIISSNGEAQVQSDWDVTDSNSKAYIRNKPSIPAAQIQSDWNQTNTNAKDYIKNKPSIPSYTGASGINVSSNIVSLDNPIGLVAGDNITITVSGTSAIISANGGSSFPVSAEEACQYVQNNSATIDDVNTTYQNASGTYLTAVDLSDYVPVSAYNELKTSYATLSSLFATYSGQWLLPNEGV